MSYAQAQRSGEIGVFGLLGIVFVVLKLTGVIDWSWWYVTMPFWGGIAVLIAISLVLFLFMVVVSIFDN